MVLVAEFSLSATPAFFGSRERFLLRTAPWGYRSGSRRHRPASLAFLWKKEAAILIGVAVLTVGAYRFVQARRLADSGGPRRCPDCRGEGRVKCFQCQGKTFFQVEGERVPHACLRCGATGRITCGRCSGTGYITPAGSEGPRKVGAGESSSSGPNTDQSGDDPWKLPDQFRQSALFLWFDWYRQRRASAFAQA
jgi:hypothetical protein